MLDALLSVGVAASAQRRFVGAAGSTEEQMTVNEGEFCYRTVLLLFDYLHGGAHKHIVGVQTNAVAHRQTHRK